LHEIDCIDDLGGEKQVFIEGGGKKIGEWFLKNFMLQLPLLIIDSRWACSTFKGLI